MGGNVAAPSPFPCSHPEVCRVCLPKALGFQMICLCSACLFPVCCCHALTPFLSGPVESGSYFSPSYLYLYLSRGKGYLVLLKGQDHLIDPLAPPNF